MKFFLKELAWRGLNLLPANRLAGRASILMYHSFGDDPASFTVKAETFDRQLTLLEKNGARVVSISELVGFLERGEDISNSVSLTIDDGYENVYTEAFPLLKKHEMRASVFIVTDLLGKSMTNSEGVTLPMMSEKQVREMTESGFVEFHPHTASHITLSRASLSEARREIEKSRAAIERLTGGPAAIFAYPKGKYTSAHPALLSELGFAAALTVRPGLVTEASDRFQLPRNGVNSATTDAQFKGLIRRTVERWETLTAAFAALSDALFYMTDFIREVLRGKTIYRILFNWKVRRHARAIRGTVLDIASGAKPSYLRYLYPGVELVQSDYGKDSAGVQAIDMNKPLPFPDASFDAALLFNAIYIAEDRNALLRECRRILRGGGRLYIMSPFLAHEMREPHDYVRLTSEGLERELLTGGFLNVTIEPVGDRFTVAANLMASVGAGFKPMRILWLFLYPVALLFDRLVPRRYRARSPAHLGYFCVAEKE